MNESQTKSSPLIILLIITVGLVVISVIRQSDDVPRIVRATVTSAQEICFSNGCHEEVYFGETANSRVSAPSEEHLKKGEVILLKKDCGFSMRYCGYTYIGRKK